MLTNFLHSLLRWLIKPNFHTHTNLFIKGSLSHTFSVLSHFLQYGQTENFPTFKFKLNLCFPFDLTIPSLFLFLHFTVSFKRSQASPSALCLHSFSQIPNFIFTSSAFHKSTNEHNSAKLFAILSQGSPLLQPVCSNMFLIFS